MASARDVRRLAFQALYQLDAQGTSGDRQTVRVFVDEAEGFTPEDRQRAWNLATRAFDARTTADEAMLKLAPQWPAHRQAAVDRAILRLAHYEMTSGWTPPKVAVNEAVELAKEFSTEKSPAFVNGLLDNILKSVLAAAATAAQDPAPAPAADAPADNA